MQFANAVSPGAHLPGGLWISDGSTMKLQSLKIINLRTIRRFEINDLGNFVVVAGQNGAGKSCVFDAIRLLGPTPVP
jgi:uncharacterized protein YPO0396